ncbi:hypothetical protein Pcac1_g23478 [Phytophthora cactorum]|nr:hypothetical protein Pcac1_g23478 [Phytophthora cactorum]
MNDDRLGASSRPFSDASALLHVVDTRASQSLEPIRLPAKLRDRIDRAQRRANAAKDGVSIFTKNSKDSAVSVPAATVGRRTATAPTPETSTASMFGDFVDPHRASTANGGMDDKMHLPNVVLSHKMRDFEARANAGGNVALFSVEPADRSLQGLSLEDRERVMLAMQAKIRQIASDVDANFARITKALDANGIFDSAANIQRAQTLCLVDLQRRCKLDKLRDEAMREVLNLPTPATANQKGPVNPSRKLSQLLRPISRAKSSETTAAALNSTNKRRKRKPVCSSKLPSLITAGKSLNEKSNNQSSSSPLSHQQNTGDTDDSKGPGVTRMLTRRGGLAPPAAASQIVAREEVGFNSMAAGNKSTNDWELYTRHSHVTQILQLLATGETSNTKGSVDTIVEDEDERDEDGFNEEKYDQNDEDNSEEGEEREDGMDYDEDDAESVDSSRTGFSARSSMSMSSVKRRSSNGNRKHGKSKRPPTVQRRSSRGPGGRSAGNTLTGHALSLHARLEVIWRVLQFPYSNKLTMLERLSTLQDADAFVSVLEHWERVTPLVAIRQRMKLALSGYTERGDLRPNEWLTPSEFALVSALSQPSKPNSDAVPPRKTSLHEFGSISPSAFIDWVRNHFDVVTLQIQTLANDLKTHTGEELQFQGHPYPRRG